MRGLTEGKRGKSQTSASLFNPPRDKSKQPGGWLQHVRLEAGDSAAAS